MIEMTMKPSMQFHGSRMYSRRRRTTLSSKSDPTAPYAINFIIISSAKIIVNTQSMMSRVSLVLLFSIALGLSNAIVNELKMMKNIMTVSNFLSSTTPKHQLAHGLLTERSAICLRTCAAVWVRRPVGVRN